MDRMATIGQNGLKAFSVQEQRQLTGMLRAAITLDPAKGKPFWRGAVQLAHILMVLLICSLAVFALKSFVLYRLGPAAYAARCAKLSRGNSLDRIGAMIMAPDQVSLFASGAAHKLLDKVSPPPNVPMLSPTLQVPELSAAPQAPLLSLPPQVPKVSPILQGPTMSRFETSHPR